MKDAAPAPDAETTSWKDRPARYWRDPETGQYHRVAFARVQFWSWIGGRGYVPVQRVMVWNPTAGDTYEEAGKAAAPGERFAAVMTEEQFACKTFPAQDLPPIGRRLARRALTARPGTEQVCRFIKRTNGELRVMRFQYDPDRGRAPFPDAEAKGLLPVFDVERGAQRFINHRGGVRTVAGQPAPELAA